MILLRRQLLLQWVGPLPRSCLLPAGYRLDAYAGQSVCECGGRLRIAKTVVRHPAGPVLGRPELHVHVRRCCTCGSWYHPEALDEIVGRGRIYGYMLITHIGLARFSRHKQIHEIQQEMCSLYDLSLPESTISELADDFLDLLHALHLRRTDSIREDFEGVQGGFVMALDGTCELGSDVLFIVRDTVSEIILHAAKMPTENEQDVRNVIEQTTLRFGTPLATLSDLSPKILRALELLPSKVKRFICHYHFLENVGKALLGDVHTELVRLIKKTRIKSRLHGRRKDMVRESKRKVPVSEEGLLGFIQSGVPPPNVSSAQLRRRLAHFALKWLDDSRVELKGEYFPFEQPILAWYRRAVQVYDCLAGALSVAPDQGDRRLFDNLLHTLKPLKEDPKVTGAARRFEAAVALFRELREYFRFPMSNSRPIRRSCSTQEQQADPATTHKKIAKFIEELQARIDRRTDEEQSRNARIVRDYYDKYKDYLGPRVVRTALGNSSIIVPRTNNGCEVGFKKKKHGWRRTLGTKKVTRKLQSANPAEMLVPNLCNSTYLRCVCGGDRQRLPALFAEVAADAAEIARQRKSRPDAHMKITGRNLRRPGMLTRIVGAVSQYAAALF